MCARALSKIAETENKTKKFYFYIANLLSLFLPYANKKGADQPAPYANNKGSNQPAHLGSLISTFVVRWLDSIIPLVSISEIPSLYLAPVAVQAGMSLIWLKTAKTGFLVTRFI